MLPTIQTLRQRLTAPGAHQALIEQVLAGAAAPAAAHVFTALFAEPAMAAARAADEAQAAGRPLPPLAGLPVTVKDLYDIAGRTTRAGAVLRQDAPAALRDAEAVARLRAAGAAIVGLTNMSEFAFSGVGLNPHYGTPRNPAATAADPTVARIPGGSSSGAAVSVALGLAVAGLGSDTGGSIRIPAALCGLVGFKNTQARTPLAGAFPLSFTLDTVCAMTRSVADCLVVDGVLAGAPLPVAARGVAGLRLALPRTLMLDALEPAVATALERALARLSAAGAVIVELPLAELAEIAQINAPGGFSAVEAWVTHRQAMQTRRERFDPRVAARIAPGEGVSAADYITMQQRRRDWMARVTQRLSGFDALICPTVPITAPPIAELVASDEAFFKANALLLRNTFAINFLDGCAFTLPCHAAGELPVGLMLAAPAGQDAALAGVALAVEARVAS
ncbi:amidase [Brevundimonas sp.]|uniref:amidase n=1 Tax=Brevundimonas sp. TaxID=1871086 RepID=UPI002731262B|nr:amidase [Brevundimonas sp.]MDP1912219.1 amidase [Brevundimonas sp.]